MQPRYYLLLLVFIIIISANVFASTPVNGEMIFSFGFGIPTAPSFFNDWWDPGIRFSFGGGINVGNNISITGIIDYGMFGFNANDYASSFGIPPGFLRVSGGNSNIFTITSGANIYLIPKNKPISPFFLGRIGFVRHHIDDAYIYVPEDVFYVSSETRSGLMIYFGGGVNIKTGKNINIFTDIKYGIGMMNNTDNRSVIPIDIGMSYIF